MKLHPVARIAALVALVAAGSGGASAAPFTGSLTVYVFSTQQGMPAVVFGGGNGTSTSGLVTVPGDVFVGTATATTPTSAAPPITGNRFVVTGHDPGSFTGDPVAGAMALRGSLLLSAFGGPLLSIPLSAVGAEGAKAFWDGGGVSVTAIGAGWSAGNVAVTVPTSMGGVRTTSFAGYDHRVNGVGTLQLVTPIRVRSNIGGDTLFWSALKLTFVPEPTTALLLGMGAVGLGIVGRARSRAAR
jgi:hypothetical protein